VECCKHIWFFQPLIVVPDNLGLTKGTPFHEKCYEKLQTTAAPSSEPIWKAGEGEEAKCPKCIFCDFECWDIGEMKHHIETKHPEKIIEGGD